MYASCYLVRNAVGQELELVVSLGRDVHVGFPDELSHVFSRFSLALVEYEPVAEILQRVGFEAGQATVKHQRHNVS